MVFLDRLSILDLMIVRDDKDRWTNLLTEFGCEKISEGPTFVQFRNPILATMPVDLMLANKSTFEKLVAECVPAFTSQEGAKMVSLRHLIGLKCHAVKHSGPGRVEKDVADLIGLGKAKNLNWNDEELREIVLKYGTKELYEKLRS